MAITQATDAALGNHLFDHHATRRDAIVLMVIGGPVLIAAVALLGVKLLQPPALVICGVFAGIFFLGGLALFFKIDPGVYHVHENGIRVRTQRIARDVLFADVPRVLFRSSRVTGFSANEILQIELEPGVKITVRQVRPRSASRGDMSQASHLFDLAMLIARAIVQRWEEELSAGRNVPWLRKVEFSPEGLIRKGKLCPWRDMPRLCIGGGYFFIRKQNNASAFHGECGQWNFYPAMLLLVSRGSRVEEMR